MTVRRALGIDIGGSKIAAGLLAADGTFRQINWQATARHDGAANLRAVRALLRQYAIEDVVVGLSLATTITTQGVISDPRGWFGWTGVDLASELADLAEVTIVPDAACGAVAEAAFGAGKGAVRLLYVTLGTGIAHCVVNRGRPDLGATGAGTLSGNFPPFTTSWRVAPQWRSIEDIVSGPGLAATFTGDPAAVDAKPVAAAFRQGEWAACRLVEHASWQTGSLIAALTTILDPDGIVIGGGLADGFPEYVAKVEEVVEILRKESNSGVLHIRQAKFGVDSCWIGAATIARNASLVEGAET